MKNLLANEAGCKDKIWAFNQSSPLNVIANAVSNTPIASSQSTVKTGTVTAGILNIRNGNGLHYPIVTKVACGTKVSILYNETGWYNVELTNGQIGWVSADYVDVIK